MGSLEGALRRLDEYEKDLLSAAMKLLSNGEQKKFLVTSGKKQAAEDFRQILEAERKREP